VKMNPYYLPFRERRRLHRRAYYAQQRDQFEVCGVLLANAERQLQLHFLPNRSDKPGAWVLHRSDVASVRRAVIGTGWRVVGTFHSHPISEAVPGPQDFASIRARQLQLIYDVCGRQARLWTRSSRAQHTKANEIILRNQSKSPKL